MNTTALEYMLALEEIGTVSGTAGRFYVSPSAISQCLHNEETRLGTPIFTRVGRDKRMTPTPAGRIYLRTARQIVEIRRKTYARLDVEIHDKTAIRIASVSMFRTMNEQVILPALEQHYSKERFEIQYTDSRSAIAWILNDLADYAIINLPPTGSSQVSQYPIGEDQLVIAAPRSMLHLPTDRDPSIADCVGLPWIFPTRRHQMRDHIDSILARSKITTDRIYDVDDFRMAAHFLLDGKGITVLPMSMSSLLPAEEYVTISLPTPVPFQYLLVWPKYRGSSKRKASIPEFIRDTWLQAGFRVQL